MTYDMDWNAHPEFSVFNSDYLRGDIIPKPKNFDKMVEIAEKLSKGFPNFVLTSIILMAKYTLVN